MPSEVIIRLEDLQVIAQLGLLRHGSDDAEAKRAAAMRAVAEESADLSRALASYARCFLVNCQGSHGAGNLVEETEHLHAALARYAGVVQYTVHERRQIDGSAASERKTAASRDARSASSGTLRRAV